MSEPVHAVSDAMDDQARAGRHRLRALLTDFDAVLHAEYEALRERDTERLNATVVTKQRLASELERLAPTVAVLKRDAEHDGTDEEWRAVRDLLGRCALANRKNGAAIDASRSFVTSMIDLLTGRRAGERTYTARGRLGGGAVHTTYERV